MSWLPLAEIRARIADLTDLNRQRGLTLDERAEYQRLEANYCQRLNRLTDQYLRAQAKAARLAAEIAA